MFANNIVPVMHMSLDNCIYWRTNSSILPKLIGVLSIIFSDLYMIYFINPAKISHRKQTRTRVWLINHLYVVSFILVLQNVSNLFNVWIQYIRLYKHISWWTNSNWKPFTDFPLINESFFKNCRKYNLFPKDVEQFIMVSLQYYHIYVNAYQY